MKLRTLFAVLIACAAGASVALAQEPLRLTLAPNEIGVGTFYNGSRVAIQGEMPAEAELAVTLSGSCEDLHLKQKGKVGGLLWMNLNTVTLKEAPSAYLLCTSPGLSGAGAQADAALSGSLRLSALERRIQVEPESADHGMILGEFLKLKKSEGLYDERVENVKYEALDARRKSFTMDLTLPARLPPGAYTVTVHAVKDGRIVGEASQPLRLQMQGFPAFLAVLAFNHGALYGILATVIALAAGILTGFVFGGGKGGH